MIPQQQELVMERKRVAAARAGDKTAFDALVRLHQRPLRAFLRQRVGDQAADDVLQETFLAAWEAMPRLNLKTRFRSWLMAIALHKIGDYHRVYRRRLGRELAVETAYLEGCGAYYESCRTENRDFARTLLATLNSDQRDVMELYYFADMTLREISTRTNRNLNTVKYIFYRAHTVAAQSDAFYEPAEVQQM